MSEISNVCNAVKGHCLQAIKIMHHHANGCFDWLISWHKSVNPSRETISILSPKVFALQILQHYLTKEGRVRKFFHCLSG